MTLVCFSDGMIKFYELTIIEKGEELKLEELLPLIVAIVCLHGTGAL